MTKGEQIEAKLDALLEQNEWIVKALKYLLAQEAGVELEDVDPEETWWEAEVSPDQYPADMSQFEHVAVRSAPKAPEPPACRHRQQVLVGGMLRCADVDQLGCRFVFMGTGLRGRDATSPVPAAGQENQFNHGTRV